MLVERWIISTLHRDSLLQLLGCLFDSSQLEQHPPHTVDIGSVLRLSGQSLGDHGESLVEVLALIGPEITQVVVRLGVVRVLGQNLFENRLALGHVSLQDIDRRETEATVLQCLCGQLRLAVLGQHFFINADRIIQPLSVVVHPANLSMQD